jgi:hypothetical protein
MVIKTNLVGVLERQVLISNVGFKDDKYDIRENFVQKKKIKKGFPYEFQR